MIEAKRIDLVFINNKEKEVRMIDVAVPVDLRVNDKEFEKIEKDQLLKDETLRLWNMCVILIVIGALGVVSKGFEKLIQRLGLNTWFEVIQLTVLLAIAHILRNVLSL